MAAQNGQVLRYGRLIRTNHAGQLTRTALSPAQTFDDRQPRLVRERLQNLRLPLETTLLVHRLLNPSKVWQFGQMGKPF